MRRREFVALGAAIATGAVSESAGAAGQKSTFAIGDTDFLLDGKRFQIRSGEMHFARIPRPYWRHRLEMVKAIGCNTVCAYLFWNMHEPEPGKFSFGGISDVAAYCKLAQEVGLKVILRPGPYACAEWEFGGFPWWLLKTPDIKLRTRDDRFLAAVKRYLLRVGKELVPMQVDNGGPIIMVQVENEYGSYGKDREYIGAVRDILKEAGFTVPLFTCDGPSQLKNDIREDIFAVVNFGGDPNGGFAALRKVQSNGPLMCGEFYPGWFDHWGDRHHYGNSAGIVRDLTTMLETGASFSIYMIHGGTSFGLTSGMNAPPFEPDITSYDYDAPINEAGHATEKFTAIRELFGKHLLPGETLGAIPPAPPVIEIPKFQLTNVARIMENLPKPVKDERPKTMELYDQAQGCILYRTELPGGPAGTLLVKEAHDYAPITLGGKPLGTLDRRRGKFTVKLPERSKAERLDIFVEAFGKVNYGPHLHDRKGITEKVLVQDPAGERELTGFEVFNLPLAGKPPTNLKYRQGKPEPMAFHRGTFKLAETGDTFLDMRGWGKGMVWVNGNHLGRYWSLGPQQILYLPGCWLKTGENEIVVMEMETVSDGSVVGLKEPILDEVKQSALAKLHRKPGQSLDLSGVTPIHSGSLLAGKEWRTVKFGATERGRYLCLEALNSHIPGEPYATLAELILTGADGKELPRDDWSVVYADSEEIRSEHGSADNVFDLQDSTYWHTEWSGGQPKHPHTLVLDLGAERAIAGMKLLPRQDQDHGRIRDFRVYLSSKPFPIH